MKVWLQDTPAGRRFLNFGNNRGRILFQRSFKRPDGRFPLIRFALQDSCSATQRGYFSSFVLNDFREYTGSGTKHGAETVENPQS